MDDNNNNNNSSRETEQVESAVDTLSLLSSGKNPSSPDFGMESSKLKDEALILFILATPPREKEGYNNRSKDLTIDILDRYSVTSSLLEGTAQNLYLDNVDHEAKDGVLDVQTATVDDKAGTKSTPDPDSAEIELKVGITKVPQAIAEEEIVADKCSSNNSMPVAQNGSSAGRSPALMTTKSNLSSWGSLFIVRLSIAYSLYHCGNHFDTDDNAIDHSESARA